MNLEIYIFSGSGTSCRVQSCRWLHVNIRTTIISEIEHWTKPHFGCQGGVVVQRGGYDISFYLLTQKRTRNISVRKETVQEEPIAFSVSCAKS